jgi:hypothetical protein
MHVVEADSVLRKCACARRVSCPRYLTSFWGNAHGSYGRGEHGSTILHLGGKEPPVRI